MQHHKFPLTIKRNLLLLISAPFVWLYASTTLTMSCNILCTTQLLSHYSYQDSIISALWCQTRVFQTGISNCIPQNNVGYNCLSLPEIPRSSFAAPQQPLVVAMSNDSYTTLDVATINSMSICGSVTPSALNAILFVTVICPRRIMVETHRYVYIYQELSSYLQLLELEVEDSKWRS